MDFHDPDLQIIYPALGQYELKDELLDAMCLDAADFYYQDFYEAEHICSFYLQYGPVAAQDPITAQSVMNPTVVNSMFYSYYGYSYEEKDLIVVEWNSQDGEL